MGFAEITIHKIINAFLENFPVCNGTDGEREKVQGIISEVIDLIITKSKGSRNGLTELLSPQTLTNVIQSMRIPDWVLLFFKLQTRLPYSAWQTLLNLTRLGKSGVSY